jgi:hypothetical protein
MRPNQRTPAACTKKKRTRLATAIAVRTGALRAGGGEELDHVVRETEGEERERGPGTR